MGMVFTVQGNKDEMVCALAAMILNDGKVEISEDNLNSAIKAANATCAPYMSKAFAALCDGVDVNKFLILRAGGSGVAAAAAPVEEEEEEEEEECDMGFDLFD